MSKAFKREEDLPDPLVTRRLPSSLPPGTKNYLTADGARRLREELERLIAVQHELAAAAENRSDARAELQALDHRIQCLRQSLQSAVIVHPPTQPEDRVRFGATVSVREPGGEESRYRIVGADETDVDRGWVSWLSPIAKALLNARTGERVRLRLPDGERVLEIIGVTYE
jgi:transcription elongation factor GreB